MRALPDSHLNLRDASDFILTSSLGKKALESTSLPHFLNFLLDLISTIYQLTISCHLPEFTDHGLPHLCSLVDRVSQWTCNTSQEKSKDLLYFISKDEAAILLLALLFHDMGMLSQSPEDVDGDQPELKTKGQMDLSTWVRRTHVDRLKKLVHRLFRKKYPELIRSKSFGLSIKIAKAHSKWPWEDGFKDLPGKGAGLASIVAIADLLDEDSNRCDTSTLIDHKQGSLLNIAHWLRHSLTSGRVMVSKGHVEVKMVKPPGTDEQIAPVFAALRNHYRLVKLYNHFLDCLGAGSLEIDFGPETIIPDHEAPGLRDWKRIPGFYTQKALLFHLLETFFPLALLDSKREPECNIQKLGELEMEPLDLEFFYKIRGIVETHSPYEKDFLALLEEDQ